MKKIFSFAMLITLISANAFSQGPSSKRYKEPPVQDKEFYLNKAKTYNTVGGVLLGAGSVLFVTGIFVYENNNDNSGCFMNLMPYPEFSPWSLVVVP